MKNSQNSTSPSQSWVPRDISKTKIDFAQFVQDNARSIDEHSSAALLRNLALNDEPLQQVLSTYSEVTPESLHVIARIMGEHSHDRCYDLQREVLAALMRKWQVLRQEAWDAFMQVQPKRIENIKNYLKAREDALDVKAFDADYKQQHPTFASEVGRWDQSKLAHWQSFINDTENKSAAFIVPKRLHHNKGITSEVSRAYQGFLDETPASSYFHVAVKGLCAGCLGGRIKDLLSSFERAMKRNTIQYSDIIQQVDSAFDMAMRYNDDRKGTQFPTYLKHVLKICYEKLKQLENAGVCHKTGKANFYYGLTSLSTPIGDKDEAAEIGDFIADEKLDSISTHGEGQEQFTEVLSNIALLSKHRRQVLELRFGLASDDPEVDQMRELMQQRRRKRGATEKELLHSYTLEEIADVFPSEKGDGFVTRQRVEKLEKQALEKLRDYLECADEPENIVRRDPEKLAAVLAHMEPRQRWVYALINNIDVDDSEVISLKKKIQESRTTASKYECSHPNHYSIKSILAVFPSDTKSGYISAESLKGLIASANSSFHTLATAYVERSGVFENYEDKPTDTLTSNMILPNASELEPPGLIYRPKVRG